MNRVDSNTYVGIEFQRKREDRTVYLSQPRYTLAKLTAFNMAECREVRSPLSTDDMYGESIEDNVYQYREAIGSLLYLATKTRPDICFAVTLLARFVSKPLEVHVRAVKRIFRYLSGTRNFGIKLGGHKCKFKLLAYSDADFAGRKTDRKTTTGYVIMFNGPILWRTKTQKVIVDNTSEAEYIACSMCSKDLRYIMNILTEINISFEKPTVFVDNQSALVQLKQLGIPSKLKHIEIKHHLIRQLIQENILAVEWIETGKQLADWLTKGLSPDKHERMIELWNMFVN